MICLIAKLDEASTGKLRALQDVAARMGASPRPLYGHITIASYVGDEEAAFVRECQELLAGTASFAVSYPKIEVLSETSIIVASPENAGELARLHEKIATGYADLLDRWTAGEDWYPHTTLLYDPEADLERICEEMQKVFEPFEAKVERLEFSKVSERGYDIFRNNIALK